MPAWRRRWIQLEVYPVRASEKGIVVKSPDYRAVCSLVLALTLGLAHVAASQEFTTPLTANPAEASFIHEDVENFVRAHAMLTPGVDTLAILQTEYLDKGTPGLIAFIGKYDLTSESLIAAIRSHPKRYAACDDLPQLLTRQAALTRQAFARLKEHIPNIMIPPTYFLIESGRGIGSGSKEGQLISVEIWARPFDGKETMIVHELVHFQQAMAVGFEKYVALYGPEKSLLGLCIREGTAEFLADLVTGEITQTRALKYTVQNERRLWEQFVKEMNGAETGDWMWGQPRDPEQPKHLGYALGYRIVAAYYKASEVKARAVDEILGVTDYAAFLERSGYPAWW